MLRFECHVSLPSSTYLPQSSLGQLQLYYYHRIKSTLLLVLHSKCCPGFSVACLFLPTFLIKIFLEEDVAGWLAC